MGPSKSRIRVEFSRGVSDAIVRTDPKLYTTTFSKVGRERKILIDYLRNNRTNTSVSAYSPRARTGATAYCLIARPTGFGPEIGSVV